jgi:hypothetical protein
MIDEIQTLLDRYQAWLRDRTALRQFGDWVEITTPYLDRHNDALQVYAQRTDGGYILTDDGYIIHDLEMSGCDLGTKKRKELLEMTLNGLGVQVVSDALTVQASPDNFSLKKHNLLQAMLAVNDMFYLASPNVASLFLEDVAAWLNIANIRYTPSVKFTGKSGYDHWFDFVIPMSPVHQAPERIVKTINAPTRDIAQSVVFSWLDTRDTRPVDSRMYAILNDIERTPSSNVMAAFQSYDVKTVLWSHRDTVVEELAA